MTTALIETIRLHAGRAPFLGRHAARLAAACDAIGLPQIELPLAEIVARRAGRRDGVVRIEMSARGIAVTERDLPLLTSLAVIVAGSPHVPYPHKTTSRAVFDSAQEEARAAGADDAILVTAGGVVAEGTSWNIFWWEGDRLATPPLSLGVLPGIARARVLELVPTIERECPVRDLHGRGLFATNAVRGVVAIERLNGAATPSDPRTAQLADRFWPH